MTSRSTCRGHVIENTTGVWRFADTGEPAGGSNRPCGHCKKHTTVEDHDACIGALPGLMNACCGHGVVDDAYVQTPDGKCVRGWIAVRIMRKLSREAV